MVNDIVRNRFQRPGEHAKDFWLGNWIEKQRKFLPFQLNVYFYGSVAEDKKNWDLLLFRELTKCR
jgi:hypothetical protein